MFVFFNVHFFTPIRPLDDEVSQSCTIEADSQESTPARGDMSEMSPYNKCDSQTPREISEQRRAKLREIEVTIIIWHWMANIKLGL